mmetsp:Transcript_20961/g.45308  ORF Transcript_20961/g.45308 Transcript_20961/m.45308 type:complete len:521 (-) Transcript_20961:413-1975(-)|eukprot:CAMPEP_0206491234 /NCGR_PEP_ID=MMETSP0324_2-20121206/44796_1 /ASSEMBLY_ACC=CAM_ASM_000836 /TAXON_ID=2866 /ORGANISM="Crypthecodinium cohnii, Strain Seligo" /LENGTH=520 /DNA_ID=CAMNT_0053972229 /DNA_START=46 /DNA_END=1608 /DNA_ORIENTATION=-
MAVGGRRQEETLAVDDGMTSNDSSKVTSSDSNMSSSEDSDMGNAKGRRPRCGPLAYMIGLAACAALNSTNIGFDIGVSSGVAVILERQWNLSGIQVGLFMGSIHFVAAMGALCSQAVSDRLGRRLTFTVAQAVLVVGLLLSVTAQNFAWLMSGRIFLGIGVGLSLAIDPLYIAEVAPSKRRGCFTTWPDIALNLGILFGFAVNLLFSSTTEGAETWRLMIGSGLIMPTLLIILSLTVMPESPRWLAARGKYEEAQYVLSRTHGPNANLDKVMKGIRKEIEFDKEQDRVGWRSVLCPNKDVAKMLIVGIGIAIAQQMNGSESIVAYSPVIFKRASVATTESALFAATILVGVVKTSFVVLAAICSDAWGRRPLLIISSGCMTISLAVLAIATAYGVGWLSVTAVCVFMATFSAGVGPMTWLMAAESFPSHYRAKGMSLSCFFNRLMSGTVALTFLPLQSALGGQAAYFGFYSGLTAVSAVWMIAVCPETNGKTLEELHDKSSSSDDEHRAYAQETSTESDV